MLLLQEQHLDHERDVRQLLFVRTAAPFQQDLVLLVQRPLELQIEDARALQQQLGDPTPLTEDSRQTFQTLGTAMIRLGCSV